MIAFSVSPDWEFNPVKSIKGSEDLCLQILTIGR